MKLNRKSASKSVRKARRYRPARSMPPWRRQSRPADHAGKLALVGGLAAGVATIIMRLRATSRSRAGQSHTLAQGRISEHSAAVSGAGAGPELLPVPPARSEVAAATKGSVPARAAHAAAGAAGAAADAVGSGAKSAVHAVQAAGSQASAAASSAKDGAADAEHAAVEAVKHQIDEHVIAPIKRKAIHYGLLALLALTIYVALIATIVSLIVERLS